MKEGCWSVRLRPSCAMVYGSRTSRTHPCVPGIQVDHAVLNHCLQGALVTLFGSLDQRALKVWSRDDIPTLCACSFEHRDDVHVSRASRQENGRSTELIFGIDDVGPAFNEDLQELGEVVLRGIMGGRHMEGVSFVNVGPIIQLRQHLAQLILLNECAETWERRHDGAGRGEPQVLRLSRGGGPILSVSRCYVVTPCVEIGLQKLQILLPQLQVIDHHEGPGSRITKFTIYLVLHLLYRGWTFLYLRLDLSQSLLTAQRVEVDAVAWVHTPHVPRLERGAVHVGRDI
mmetsp:Transcript_34868/g.93188  ORF Transcript_34868/g.93188 Transcript_34868/m.93188 type:complete len:287 (-) Transcript_34868:732-1592(-)